MQALNQVRGGCPTCASGDGSALLHDMMIQVARPVIVPAGEMRAAAEQIERRQRHAERALAFVTGKPEGLWRLLMGCSSTLDAKSMMRHGIVGEISPSSKRVLRRQHFAGWAQRLADSVEEAIGSKAVSAEAAL